MNLNPLGAIYKPTVLSAYFLLCFL